MTSLLTNINLVEAAGSNALLTREQGERLRVKIEALVQENNDVILDLTDVTALSPSFADELFALLQLELGGAFSQRVKIICPKNDWKQLIRSVMAHRYSSKRN